MKLQMAMPLAGQLTEKDGSNRDLKEAELPGFAEDIQQAFQEKKGFRQLQDFTAFIRNFRGDPQIYAHVIGMQTTASIDNNGLFGEMTFYCRQALTPSQQNELAAYVDAQFGQGLGEKLWAHTIPVTGGNLRLRMEAPYTSGFIIDAEPQPMIPKYRITNIHHPRDQSLRRIQALRDINPQVPKGTLGGFVENEWNLSQSGTCWIYDRAVCKGGARVSHAALLTDSARAEENAFVTGNARLYGDCIARGDCYIQDAVVTGGTLITGEAILEPHYDTKVAPHINGASRIYGTIRGSFIVIDSTLFPGDIMVNPTEDMMVLDHGEKSACARGERLAKNQQASKRKKNQPER